MFVPCYMFISCLKQPELAFLATLVLLDPLPLAGVIFRWISRDYEPSSLFASVQQPGADTDIDGHRKNRSDGGDKLREP